MDLLKDYLRRFGEFLPDEVKWNEVDALVFAWLSYADFSGVLTSSFKQTLSLREVVDSYLQQKGMPTDKKYLPEYSLRSANLLLVQLVRYPRYQQVRLCGFVDRIEPTVDLQFAALSLLLPTKELVVSFRGTDNTLAGWKEDCYLSFQESVPAQKEARQYLLQAMNFFPKKKTFVVGHSKGGNLAMYASMLPSSVSFHRIQTIYNFDGPGFNKKVTETVEYQKMATKLVNYVPVQSIVGLLLNGGGKFHFIKSKNIGLLQHDGMSWGIKELRFDRVKAPSQASFRLASSIAQFLEGLSNEDQQFFVDRFFDAVESGENYTFNELIDNPIGGFLKILKNLGALPKEERDRMRTLFSQFKKIFIGFVFPEEMEGKKSSKSSLSEKTP